jgi:hypothetical protein
METGRLALHTPDDVRLLLDVVPTILFGIVRESA